MKWLYYRFVYRHLMRLSHRFNWHHTRTIYPEGDTMLVCDWCGLRYVQYRNYSGYKIMAGTGCSPTAAQQREPDADKA